MSILQRPNVSVGHDAVTYTWTASLSSAVRSAQLESPKVRDTIYQFDGAGKSSGTGLGYSPYPPYSPSALTDDISYTIVNRRLVGLGTLPGRLDFYKYQTLQLKTSEEDGLVNKKTPRANSRFWVKEGYK